MSLAAFSEVQKYVKIKSFRGSVPDPTEGAPQTPKLAAPSPRTPLPALGSLGLKLRPFWPRSAVPPSKNCLKEAMNTWNTALEIPIRLQIARADSLLVLT